MVENAKEEVDTSKGCLVSSQHGRRRLDLQEVFRCAMNARPIHCHKGR
jgi:hypothetical protein